MNADGTGTMTMSEIAAADQLVAHADRSLPKMVETARVLLDTCSREEALARLTTNLISRSASSPSEQCGVGALAAAALLALADRPHP